MPGSPRAGPVHGEQSGKGPVSYKLALAMGFPGGSVGKESAHNAGALGWEDPLEKGMATHSSVLAWRIPWTGSAKSQTSLTFTFYLPSQRSNLALLQLLTHNLSERSSEWRTEILCWLDLTGSSDS